MLQKSNVKSVVRNLAPKHEVLLLIKEIKNIIYETYGESIYLANGQINTLFVFFLKKFSVSFYKSSISFVVGERKGRSFASWRAWKEVYSYGAIFFQQ